MESSSKSNSEADDVKKWATIGHWKTPYFGYVQSLEEVEMALKHFSDETKSKYVVYQKEKTFGAEAFNLNKCRIFFKATEERQANPLSVWPEFDGIPFIVLGRKIYGCHLGKDKDFGAKLKHREQTMSQDTPKIPFRASKKLGCPARISMVQIVKFPDYKVEKIDSDMQRREIFKKLHSDVNKDPKALKYEVRFYMKFSKPEDHSHTISYQGEDKFRGSMDYRLVRHLCYIHHQGISRLSEIETALTQYVKESLYPDGDAPAKGIYPGLYPDPVAIQYYINNAKCREQLIHIDSKIFNKVVEEWRDLYPTHSFYYQAYVKESTNNEPQKVKDHHYARDMVEPGNLQSFMFCYQSDIQQRLLARFGQTLAVLDMNNKVPVPTYFLMVRTNTCYQVVAIISLQFPCAPNFKQALAFLREVNPGWNPQYLMMHNTQQDIDVVQQVFPDSEIHVLDSCRQISWKKWLGKNCKEDSDMEVVYQMLEEAAKSRTEEESNQAWETVTQLGLWRFNASFRYYLTNTWMENKKRWCHYCRSDPLVVTLTVNDGLEQLSYALKHEWLEELKKRRLTEIFSGIVSEYLPAHYYKHLSQNLVLPALANHNSKRSSVPKYIKSTPPVIQAHITELIKSMPATAEVTKHAPGCFTITFPDNPSCNLTFGNELQYPSCSCSYWQETRMICHHFCVIFGSFPNYGWDQLSVRYIKNPIFAVDEVSLPAHIRTMFRVDNLQQQAATTENALQAVKQVIVGRTEMEEDAPTMEIVEDAAVEDEPDGESTMEVPTGSETQVPEPTVDEETSAAAENIAITLIETDDGVVDAEMIFQAILESQEPPSPACSADQIIAKCKQHLQALANTLDHIKDVDSLVRLEQYLAGLVQEGEKSFSKRRKTDPD